MLAHQHATVSSKGSGIFSYGELAKPAQFQWKKWSAGCVCTVVPGGCLLFLPCRWPLTPTADRFMVQYFYLTTPCSPLQVFFPLCLFPCLFWDVSTVISSFQLHQSLCILITFLFFSWEFFLKAQQTLKWGHSLLLSQDLSCLISCWGNSTVWFLSSRATDRQTD